MKTALSHLDFGEDYKNKHAGFCKGNQHTFFRHPDVTVKAMNKEERNSHVLPFKHWIVYFLPFCRATHQGTQENIRSAKQDDIYGASNIVLPCPGS
jgi:hypothetical protein